MAWRDHKVESLVFSIGFRSKWLRNVSCPQLDILVTFSHKISISGLFYWLFVLVISLFLQNHPLQWNVRYFSQCKENNLEQQQNQSHRCFRTFLITGSNSPKMPFLLQFSSFFLTSVAALILFCREETFFFFEDQVFHWHGTIWDAPESQWNVAASLLRTIPPLKNHLTTLCQWSHHSRVLRSDDWQP